MAVWWTGQLLIAVVGVLVARSNDAFLPLLLALAGAAFFAGPYLTLVGGSHPRFLIPAYALLSIALGYVALSWLAYVDGRARWLAAAILAAGVLRQAGVHAETLARVLKIQVRISDIFSDDVELPEPYASWQRLQLQEGRSLYAFLSPR